MYINFDPTGRAPKSLLGRVLAAVGGILALGAVLLFSAVLFVVLAVVALLAFAFFWWKTRALRRSLREQAAAEASYTTGPATGEAGAADAASERGDAQVIEGESVRVDDDRSLLK